MVCFINLKQTITFYIEFQKMGVDVKLRILYTHFYMKKSFVVC